MTNDFEGTLQRLRLADAALAALETITDGALTAGLVEEARADHTAPSERREAESLTPRQRLFDAFFSERRDRQQLIVSYRSDSERHPRVHRPWGFFETLSLRSGYEVKLLHVESGAQLSIQSNHPVSQYWVIVKGIAKVTREDEERLVGESESIRISTSQLLRLENPGEVPLEIIEVQAGSCLLEDDSVRGHDLILRAANETE